MPKPHQPRSSTSIPRRPINWSAFPVSARQPRPASSSTRQKNGGFKKIEELMNVRGIGEKAFLKMKNQLAVTAPKAEQQ